MGPRFWRRVSRLYLEVCDFIASVLSGDFSRCCPGVRIGFPDHGENSPVLYGFVYGCPSSRQRCLSGDRKFSRYSGLSPIPPSKFSRYSAHVWRWSCGLGEESPGCIWRSVISSPPFLVVISPGAVREFAFVSPIRMKILQHYTGFVYGCPSSR